MKLELYKDAVISVDLPEFGLRKGDIVKLVDDLQAADGSPGYAVGSSKREPRRESLGADGTSPSNFARWAEKRTSANRRKIRPRTGSEYSDCLSPAPAQSWFAASQRRLSNAA